MSTLTPARLLVLSFGILLATTRVSGGTEPLTVSVSPALSQAPSTVRIQVRVDPRPENRILAVVADSGDYYRSSTIELDAEHSPPTVVISYPNLPGGDYEVVCVLIDNAGHKKIARANVKVI
jgi:hypothetical protein